ncbi:S-layer homology domain-containing protein [Anaerotignum sp.]|uniref:S-layer homology domain-containing protein n=1 Tax=Anaerotignum sp. TaxID=2039241 RepID=UPI002A918DBF|nr:S-layer homology domain-containing protein [Anaerotignum sp.]MCI7658010.1 S-layer homology domain-containing protein [Clostridia bacterium]MDY5414120.1 S-layer homology domain-containing protein [Anaerotignum sp.]
MKNRKYGRMVAMALAAMMAMPTVAFAAGTTFEEDEAYYAALEQGLVPEEVITQDENGNYVINNGTTTEPTDPVTPVEPVALPFTDVKEGDACYAAVQYVYANKLMAGTTDTTFEPQAPLQRAMLAQILYNKEGAKDVATESKYTDVEIGRWYATSCLWAADKGLMTGVSETEFAPKENLTVEQLVQILYNYAKFKGVDVTVETATDVATASDWAKDAMSWAVSLKLVTADVDAKAEATRAQVAEMLMLTADLKGTEAPATETVPAEEVKPAEEATTVPAEEVKPAEETKTEENKTEETKTETATETPAADKTETPATK